MEKYLIDSTIRLFVFLVGSLIWIGIWLTGFDKVHWLFFLPPSFFYFASISGICPGMIISRFILRSKPQS